MENGSTLVKRMSSEPAWKAVAWLACALVLIGIDGAALGQHDGAETVT